MSTKEEETGLEPLGAFIPTCATCTLKQVLKRFVGTFKSFLGVFSVHKV